MFLHHSHKKREDSLETRAVLLIFLLELEISGVVVQRIHQRKMEALAKFCYDYSANASDAAQKIATDQKDYHKYSSCVMVC